jgi:hypothetical protein
LRCLPVVLPGPLVTYQDNYTFGKVYCLLAVMNGIFSNDEMYNFIIINHHRPQRHIKLKPSEATQWSLVTPFLFQDLFYLHFPALSLGFFPMCIWVCLYFFVPVVSIIAHFGCLSFIFLLTWPIHFQCCCFFNFFNVMNNMCCN